MDNKTDTTEQGETPREMSLLTPVDLKRVISGVVVSRELTKTHFLRSEPNPIKVIKFNYSGMTFLDSLQLGAGQGVVKVAHATDTSLNLKSPMPLALFKEWKKECNGVYTVFMTHASRRPHVVTKETALTDLQSAKAAALATGMTEEEIEKALA